MHVALYEGMQSTPGASLNALRSAWFALFAGPPANLDLSFGFSNVTHRAVGIGDLVGPDDDRVGEVFGRMIEATATVDMEAADEATLEAATAAVTDAVLDRPRETLLSQGFLSLELESLAAPTLPEGGGRARQMRFRLLFEHLARPEADGEVIGEIPLGDNVAVTAPTG